MMPDKRIRDNWGELVATATHSMSGRGGDLDDETILAIDRYIAYLHSRLPERDKRQYEWDKEL